MVCAMADESPFGAPNGVVDRANPDIGLPVAIDPRYHDAVLFDLDGVITDTASLHEAAWAQMFDEYLHGRPARCREPRCLHPRRLSAFHRR